MAESASSQWIMMESSLRHACIFRCFNSIINYYQYSKLTFYHTRQIYCNRLCTLKWHVLEGRNSISLSELLIKHPLYDLRVPHSNLPTIANSHLQQEWLCTTSISPVLSMPPSWEDLRAYYLFSARIGGTLPGDWQWLILAHDPVHVV